MEWEELETSDINNFFSVAVQVSKRMWCQLTGTWDQGTFSFMLEETIGNLHAYWNDQLKRKIKILL